MATKTIQASGGDYATPQLWVSYVAALGTLSAPEIGEMAAEEFNAGGLLLGGGSVVASATNQIILRCQTGALFTGNPLKYTDGARILFDATDEQLQVSWNHVVLKNFAIKGTSTSSQFGRVRCDYNLTNTMQNLIIEEAGSTRNLDDRGGTGCVRENILMIRTSGTTDGVRSANFNKSYLNCTAVALNSPAGNTGFERAYATPTYINCVSYGFATDYNATYGAGSKNCGTSKASGSSNIASMTGAQFSVASGDFVNATSGTHDLRVASGSTKLKDLGAASGGTTTDILGNAISGGTRDIGAHEYQAAASGLAANPIFGGGAAALPLGGYVA